MTPAAIRINNKEYSLPHQLDFLDIGGGTGGSFALVKKRFKCERGLAIDIEKKKIDQAIANGIPAIQLDATNLNIFQDNACRLVSMVHMLEHLPSKSLASSTLHECARVASDFLFIRGPMFYLDYLASYGLKFYWSDWKGHTLMIEPGDILAMIDRHLIDSFEVRYIKQVESSSDTCIHPLEGKTDRHEYDALIDPPKRMNIVFDRPIYKEFELTIKLSNIS